MGKSLQSAQLSCTIQAHNWKTKTINCQLQQKLRTQRTTAKGEAGTDGEGSSESESNDGSAGESAGESVSVVRRFRGGKSSVYNHLLASPDSSVIVAIRIPTLRSLYYAVVVMVMDCS